MNDASLVAANRGPKQQEGQARRNERLTPRAFALLFVPYTLAAWAGLTWAVIAGAAAPIWPAAGVALAGLLLGGRRLFPAIIVGVLAASLLSSGQNGWWSALLIGTGNALGALEGASLVRRFGRPSFDELGSVSDVLVLLLAAGLSAALAAVSGAAIKTLAGVIAPGDAAATALTWFFGDAVGILVIAALVLTSAAEWRAHRRIVGRLPLTSFAGALLLVIGSSAFIFFGAPMAHAWAIYPALVWVALIGRAQGAALAMVPVCVLAVSGMHLGYGPFADTGSGPDLALLQQYLGVTAVTIMLLAAAVDERRAETRLRQIAADELAARRELQRTTSLLHMVGDAAPNMIYAKDRAGRYVYANAALLKMYGKPAAAVLGLSDLDFNPITEAEVLRANDRQVIESGRALELEEQVTVHGLLRTYLSVKAPLRDDQGEVAGLVGISTDITDRRHQQDELARLARRAEIAQRAARSSLYEVDVVSGKVDRDPMMGELCGIPRDRFDPSQKGWERFIHPDDLAGFQSTVASALDGYERFALEYRIVGHDGQITWVSDAGTIVRDEAGAPLQIIGLVTDVTQQKQRDERERLLAREVDHRAKNLLAVVQSVVQMTRADDSEQLKIGITGRIQSLARAHSLLAESRWEGVELTALAAEEVAPYAEERDGRVRIEGPLVMLKPAAAQSLALVIHELATNAVKYGALSQAGGRLELSWCIQPSGGLLLVWQERDGPLGRSTPPERSGFGSRLIKASIERQLRGTVAYEWVEAGLTVTMTVAPEYVTPVARGGNGDAA